MEYSLLHGTGVRYSRGLMVCAGVAVYGLWLIGLSVRGDMVGWLRVLFPKACVLQAVIGLLLQLPLAGYVGVGFSTGMLRWS